MSGLALALGIGSQDPGDLSCRRLQDPRQPRRRRLEQADQLAVQFVERWQACQFFDAGRVHLLAGKPTADDGELAVAVRVLDDHLGRGHRIAREGDRGRTGEQRRQRLERGARKSSPSKPVLGEQFQTLPVLKA